MLNFYDEDLNAFSTNPLRVTMDGRMGGNNDIKINIRNTDPTLYYVSVNIRVEYDIGYDANLDSNSGWCVKIIYGDRRPTEKEWSDVPVDPVISIPDIGDTMAADTFTYHPIWVRIVCPGNVPAQIREPHKIKVNAFPIPVGS
jgi:hypothetical protein